MLSRTQREWIGRILCAVSLLLAFSAAAIVLAGGYSIRYGPLRLSSHDFRRDLAAAAVAGAIGAALWGRDQLESRAARLMVGTERIAIWIAAAISIAIFIVGIAAATRCACGSDQYGYVSQAELWASGTLHVPQPIAARVPWPSADWTLSPLGYRPATFPGAIVPTYAPGLPMAMALARKIAGSRSAVFVVVPILGAVAVWCTFLIGRRLDTAIVGLLGALLVACSVTFLFELIQPMSDVPATAWFVLAAALVFRGTAGSAFLAGLACSAAVLTRPNLVPLVVIFLPFVRGPEGAALRGVARGRERAALQPLVLFVLGALPGPLAVAWIQNALYGSPLRSGYGTFHDIYALANAGPNLRLYPRWLWDGHGPFIFVGLLSPFLWIGIRRLLPQRTMRVVAFALAFTVAVFVAYIFYSPFDNWTYTRFLLPAIPLALLLAVWTLVAAARRLGSPAAQAIVVFGIVLVACGWVRHVLDWQVLTTGRGESRYIAAGQYVAAATAPDVLVLAMQHSGSIRYYSGRLTVRYDWLDGHGLDAAIEAMRAMNRGPVLVLDDWETKPFTERFKGQKWGALDWPPRVEFESQPAVRVYDPFDRDRFEAHDSVRTMRIPMPR